MALTVTDLNNGKSDLNHIAEYATTTAGAVVDRLGRSKPSMQSAVDAIEARKNSSIADMLADTNAVEAERLDAVANRIPAAIDSLKAFNSRGAWANSTAYALKDVVVVAGVAYVAVTAHTSSASGAFSAEPAGRWVVHQGATKEELAAPTGGLLIGVRASPTAVPRTVQSKLFDVRSVYDIGMPQSMVDDIQGASVNDHSTAVVDAFLDAASRGYGLYLPRGKCNVSQPLKVAKAVSVFGDGRSVSIINATDPTKDVLVLEIPYEEQLKQQFFLRDFRVIGGRNGLLTHNAQPADIRAVDFWYQVECNVWGGLNAFGWHMQGVRMVGARFNLKFRGTGPSVPMDLTDSAGGISGQLNKLIGNWYLLAKQQGIHLSTAEGLEIDGGYLEQCACNDAGGNPAWAASTAYGAGATVNINSGPANGYVYRAVIGGTTGGAVPGNTTINAGVSDGSVTWLVLGRRAGIWVEQNRGFTMKGMQGERNGGTPWLVINGTSQYSYSSMVHHNRIRQTFPAPAIEINNENRIFIDHNHVIDCGPWLSIPAGSTVKGLFVDHLIYQNDESILGSLQDYSFEHMIKGTAADVFSPRDEVSGANYQYIDRKIEAQFVPNADVTYTKTYTLTATYGQFKVGYLGTFRVQIGYYDGSTAIYRMGTYELNIAKGYNLGASVTFTRVSGDTDVAWVTTTNTVTNFSGGFALTNRQGALIRVIRETPVSGQVVGSTITHGIA